MTDNSQSVPLPGSAQEGRAEKAVKILVPSYFAQHYRDQTAKGCPQAEVIAFKLRERKSMFSQQRSYDFLLDEPSSDPEDAAICVAPTELTAEAGSYLIRHLPGLRWVHSTRTGVDHLLTDEVRRRGVLVTSSHVCSDAMAEYVLAMIMAAVKGFSVHLRLQNEAEWKFVRSRMLKDQRVGVLGLGRIGQAVVKCLKAHQMEVWGWNRSKPVLKELDRYFPADRSGLQKICSECDVIVIALPLTGQTRHLLDAEILDGMNPEAWLINVSRGGIVDQEALHWRLKEQRIAGACLDVMEDQSRAALEQFKMLENVLITHHSSFYFPEYNQAVCEDFVGKLTCYLAGRPVPDTVDPQRGY